MHQSLLLALLVLASSTAAATTHIIAVGANSTLTFSPNSLTAAVGDTLSFHFYTGRGSHSVASSAFTPPCAPLPASNPHAFFSGYITGDSTGSPTFSVQVSSTDPIWFYCSLGPHCAEGMVGVVNPPSGQDVGAYKEAAKNAAASAPGSVFGGMLGSSVPGVSAATTMPTNMMPTTMIATSMMGTSMMGTSSGSSSVPGVTAATTMPTSSSTGVSGSGTSTTSVGSVAATSKPSGANAGRNGDLSVMLPLGFVLVGLVALMA